MDSDYKRLVFRLKARIQSLERKVESLQAECVTRDREILELQLEISNLQGMLVGFAGRLESLENVCFDVPPEPPHDESREADSG